ncbi:MAG TPA: ATP-binding cassette domain-containing protein [Nitrospirota bacterium]
MIRLEGVCLSLGGRQVLSDISLDLKRGETGVMLGASGSGKTTILRIILGLLKPDCGSVVVDGEEISSMGEEDLYRVRDKMGMVFQGGALFDSLTVGENVAYRLVEKGEISSGEIEDKVRESLRFVGLEDVIDLMPAELSGGMKKRVAIARGIAAAPPIMLYDEPTAGLDPLNSHKIAQLINRLREEHGVASVVVTHEMPTAFTVASKIAFIQDGKIAYRGGKEGLAASRDERVSGFLRYSGLKAYPLFLPADGG